MKNDKYLRVYWIGRRAGILADMLDSGEEDLLGKELNEVVIIDRSIDLVTPLMTQLCYEGMIDETFGIDNCILLLIRIQH